MQIHFEESRLRYADTYIRARIDTRTKQLAADALEAMGLSMSDAIRLLMLRISDERRLPFEVKVPNATIRKAISELEAGKGKKFKTVESRSGLRFLDKLDTRERRRLRSMKSVLWPMPGACGTQQ